MYGLTDVKYTEARVKINGRCRILNVNFICCFYFDSLIVSLVV